MDWNGAHTSSIIGAHLPFMSTEVGPGSNHFDLCTIKSNTANRQVTYVFRSRLKYKSHKYDIIESYLLALLICVIWCRTK